MSKSNTVQIDEPDNVQRSISSKPQAFKLKNLTNL